MWDANVDDVVRASGSISFSLWRHTHTPLKRFQKHGASHTWWWWSVAAWMCVVCHGNYLISCFAFRVRLTVPEKKATDKKRSYVTRQHQHHQQSTHALSGITVCDDGPCVAGSLRRTHTHTRTPFNWEFLLNETNEEQSIYALNVRRMHDPNFRPFHAHWPSDRLVNDGIDSENASEIGYLFILFHLWTWNAMYH